MPNEQRPLKVFLCHASADKPKVRQLYRYLKRRGIKPWFDEMDLVGGQDWQVEIPKALLTSDAIIICLTKNSVDKEGYIQKEIKFALDKALEMPEGRIFLIPVKFEECEVPFSLSRYQWVDLTIDAGYSKMMKALKFRASQLERSTVEISKKEVEEENLAREKEEREVAERAERERKEKELREKQAREASEKAKREAEKKKDKSVDVKPKAGWQIAYWFGGVTLFVLGIILFFSLGNLTRSSEPTPTSVNTNIPLPSAAISQASETPNPQVVSTTTPIPTATAVGGGAGKIIFEKSENGKNGIYIVNVDGSELKRLTDGQYNESIESLSPNGEKVLLSSSRDDGLNFYVMDVDGKNKVKLTNTSGSDWVEYKGWSPDGTNIVYRIDNDLFLIRTDGAGLVNIASNIVNAYIIGWSPEGDKLLLQDGRWKEGRWSGGEIYCVNTDGTGEINLTDNEANDWFEDWLPDGEGIIFRSERDGNLEIYKVSLDGSGMENLTQSLGDDIYGALSFNQKDLLFSSDRSGNYDVYKMDLKDYSVESLTSNISDEYYKSYSSEGAEFIFETGTGNDVDVYVADIDGSNPINLTKSLAEDRFVGWMPDGGGILFSSNRQNNNDFFVVDLDGSNLINLTKNPENDKFISWSPNNEKMLFSYESVFTEGQMANWAGQDKDDVLFVTNLDGTGLTVFDKFPVEYDAVRDALWFPDGNKLLVSYSIDNTYVSGAVVIIDLNDPSNYIEIKGRDVYRIP